MPKSRNNKTQKKRSQNYTNQVKAAKKSAQKLMMEEYQKKYFEQLRNAKEHVTGEVVENTNIEVDVNMDDMDVSLDDIEDAVVIEEEKEESTDK